MELKTAVRRIKDGKVDPVYLLKGDDHYLQQFVIKEIEQTFFGSDVVDRQLLMPDELSNREIIESILKTDLFSSRRLFILRNAHQIRDPFKKRLVEYCQNPVSNHCLVIIDDEFSSKYAIIRDIGKNINSINTTKPFESELRKWIAYFFSERGKQVTGEVISAVLEIAGDSVYHAANEVEKICLGLVNEGEITVDLVKKFSGWRREHRQWEFITAIGNKQESQSILLGKTLLAQGISLIALLYQLSALFQEMLFIKMTVGTSQTRTGYIPLSTSVRKKLPGFAQRYNYAEIEKALELLGAIDYRIKNYVINDENELSLFIINLFGFNE